MHVFVKILLLLAAHASGTYVREFVYMRSVPQSTLASLPVCGLQRSTARSKLDCSRRCFSFTSAIGLTCTPLGPDTVSCVCLISCVTSSNKTAVTLQGTALFGRDKGLPWLNKFCNKSASCPTQNSMCYLVSSTCLCTPGYYYSYTSNTCISYCDPGNLCSTFLKYSSACLEGHDDVKQQVTSCQEWAAACSANIRCLTFDYDNRSKWCFLSYDTALTSGAFIQGCNNNVWVDHYQRTCL